MKLQFVLFSSIICVSPAACVSADNGGGDGGVSDAPNGTDPAANPTGYFLAEGIAEGPFSEVVALVPAGAEMLAVTRSCATTDKNSGKTEVVALGPDGKVRRRFSVPELQPMCEFTSYDPISDGAHHAALLSSGDIALSGVSAFDRGTQMVVRYSPTGELRWRAGVGQMDGGALSLALATLGDETWVGGQFSTGEKSILGSPLSASDLAGRTIYIGAFDSAGKIVRRINVTDTGPELMAGVGDVAALRAGPGGNLRLLLTNESPTPRITLFQVSPDGSLTDRRSIDSTEFGAIDVLPGGADPTVLVLNSQAQTWDLVTLATGDHQKPDALTTPVRVEAHFSSATARTASGEPILVGHVRAPDNGWWAHNRGKTAAITLVTSVGPQTVLVPASPGSSFNSVVVDPQQRIWVAGAIAGRTRFGKHTATPAKHGDERALVGVFNTAAAIAQATADAGEPPAPSKIASFICGNCIDRFCGSTATDRPAFACADEAQSADVNAPDRVKACLDLAGPNTYSCVSDQCAKHCL